MKPSTSNCTFTPHGRNVSDLASPGYPYNTRARHWKAGNLPGGLRYASADVKEFQGSSIIQPYDPNAGGFARRLAGGGGRTDIYGNKQVLVFPVEI